MLSQLPASPGCNVLFTIARVKALTEKQENILRFIAGFTRLNGVQPSYREIAAGCRITVGTVQHYVRVLAKKGVLEPPSSRARGLKLASSPLCGLTGVGTRGYAILGRVPAGKPNLIHDEVEDTLWMDERLCRSRDAYLLRVTGDSMIGTGIFHGDLAVVRPQKAADPGDIVVARTPDGEGTVKTLKKKGDRYFLQPENPRYVPIHDEFEVVGKVVGVLRRYVS
jgi:repressor LexA